MCFLIYLLSPRKPPRERGFSDSLRGFGVLLPKLASLTTMVLSAFIKLPTPVTEFRSYGCEIHSMDRMGGPIPVPSHCLRISLN